MTIVEEKMSDDPDGFVCGDGFDEAEHATFTDVFATREEAVEAGQEDCGWIEGGTFQTARIVHSKEEMPCPLDAERACDNAENDEWGENLLELWRDQAFAEGVIDNLQAALEEAWARWVEQYKLTVTCYRFEDVEHHEFKPETTP